MKRLSVAVRAIAYVDRDKALEVVGAGSDLERARRPAVDLGVDSGVRFLGEVPWEEVIPHYDAAEAFLFTSLRDSSGVQLLEAGARGLPFVSPEHHGARDWLPPEAGALVPTGPASTCARSPGAAASKLLGDESRWRAASTNASSWPSQCTLAAHAVQMDHIHRTTVGGHRRSHHDAP